MSGGDTFENRMSQFGSSRAGFENTEFQCPDSIATAITFLTQPTDSSEFDKSSR
jgi:hypothetical protein